MAGYFSTFVIETQCFFFKEQLKGIVPIDSRTSVSLLLKL